MGIKILDELCCGACGQKLSRKHPLFDTAWSGLYWCGRPSCAFDILDAECEELDYEDTCNHED